MGVAIDEGLAVPATEQAEPDLPEYEVTTVRVCTYRVCAIDPDHAVGRIVMDIDAAVESEELAITVRELE